MEPLIWYSEAGGNDRNVLRLSQARFGYIRRRALEQPDMRPAYMRCQVLSDVFIQKLLEMAVYNPTEKGDHGRAVFGHLLEAGTYGCPVCCQVYV